MKTEMPDKIIFDYGSSKLVCNGHTHRYIDRYGRTRTEAPTCRCKCEVR